MIRSPVLAVAMACAFAVPATLSAQSWNAFTANNTGEYWDHVSNDGNNCNIGFVVTGVAGSGANTCVNQLPAGWLPYTGPAVPFNYQGAANAFAGFLFAPGSYTFAQGAGIGGDDGILAYQWGYFTTKDALGRVVVANGIPFSQTVTFASNWGFWTTPTLVSTAYHYSDTDALFALFGGAPALISSGVINPTIGAQFMVGSEIGGSDNDFNDVVVSFSRVNTPTSTVPEPSTLMLLGTGLVGVCSAARRRRAKQ